MGIHSTKSEALHSTADATHRLFGDWFDPIEMSVRERVRGFIEELIEAELEEALSRPRYGRAASSGVGNAGIALGGHRHGHRGQDHRVAEQDAAGLPATHASCGRTDRRRLPRRNQYAPGTSCACNAV